MTGIERSRMTKIAVEFMTKTVGLAAKYFGRSISNVLQLVVCFWDSDQC